MGYVEAYFLTNPTDRKVVEQSLNLSEKLFKLTKGKVGRLEGQNETLIKKIHK